MDWDKGGTAVWGAFRAAVRAESWCCSLHSHLKEPRVPMDSVCVQVCMCAHTSAGLQNSGDYSSLHFFPTSSPFPYPYPLVSWRHSVFYMPKLALIFYCMVIDTLQRCLAHCPTWLTWWTVHSAAFPCVFFQFSLLNVSKWNQWGSRRIQMHTPTSLAAIPWDPFWVPFYLFLVFPQHGNSSDSHVYMCCSKWNSWLCCLAYEQLLCSQHTLLILAVEWDGGMNCMQFPENWEVLLLLLRGLVWQRHQQLIVIWEPQ